MWLLLWVWDNCLTSTAFFTSRIVSDDSTETIKVSPLSSFNGIDTGIVNDDKQPNHCLGDYLEMCLLARGRIRRRCVCVRKER